MVDQAHGGACQQNIRYLRAEILASTSSSQTGLSSTGEGGNGGAALGHLPEAHGPYCAAGRTLQLQAG